LGREEIHIDYKGIIQSFIKPDIAVRLMSMGFIPGKKVEILRKSPLGNTWYILMDGKYFALRDTEICTIEFSKVV